MSTTHCDGCKREFKKKGGEIQRQYSSRTGRYYCPMSDGKCAAERRRLIRSGAIDLATENREVIEAMARIHRREEDK